MLMVIHVPCYRILMGRSSLVNNIDLFVWADLTRYSEVALSLETRSVFGESLLKVLDLPF